MGRPALRASSANAVANCSEVPTRAPGVSGAPNRNCSIRQNADPDVARADSLRECSTARSIASARSYGDFASRVIRAPYAASANGSCGCCRYADAAAPLGTVAASSCSGSGASAVPVTW